MTLRQIMEELGLYADPEEARLDYEIYLLRIQPPAPLEWKIDGVFGIDNDSETIQLSIK